MQPLVFVIWNRSINEALYWNNDSGWGSLDTADTFSIEEVTTRSWNLPIGGQWLTKGAASRLPNLDY